MYLHQNPVYTYHSTIRATCPAHSPSPRLFSKFCNMLSFYGGGLLACRAVYPYSPIHPHGVMIYQEQGRLLRCACEADSRCVGGCFCSLLQEKTRGTYLGALSISYLICSVDSIPSFYLECTQKQPLPKRRILLSVVSLFSEVCIPFTIRTSILRVTGM
jgi:hypothetical protein